MHSFFSGFGCLDDGSEVELGEAATEATRGEVPLASEGLDGELLGAAVLGAGDDHPALVAFSDLQEEVGVVTGLERGLDSPGEGSRLVKGLAPGRSDWWPTGRGGRRSPSPLVHARLLAAGNDDYAAQSGHNEKMVYAVHVSVYGILSFCLAVKPK